MIVNRSELLALDSDVTTSAFSLPIIRLDGARVAIQVLIDTNDLDGEIYVQASVDGVYYESDISSKYVVEGEDTSVLYEIDNPSAEYYRIRIVRNSGTYDVKIQALVSGG